MMNKTCRTPLCVVEDLYTAFKASDFEGFKRLCHADMEWIQNEGFPNGGHHHGADEVIENVFKRFKQHWQHFGFETHSMYVSGHMVFVIGDYVGTHAATGKSFRAATVHVYDVEDGLIKRFRQFTDTAMVVEAVIA